MEDRKVELFYDLVDEACMLLYEELRLDYLKAFIRVSSDLVDKINENGLDTQAISKLEDIYKKIDDGEFYNEEIRLAIELLLVKAFKHVDKAISFMTPDSVCYIFAYIIRYLGFQGATIIDTALGTANLLQAIANNCYQDLNLIGIEHEEELVNIAVASSNMQNNEIMIYYQDALKSIGERADIIVGDIDSYEYKGEYKTKLIDLGITYFPYLTMYERLNNLNPNGYFIYLIDNNFFTQKNMNKFRELLSKKATLVGLVTLPDSIFKGENRKSILIGRKRIYSNYEISVVNIKSFEKEYIEDAYVKLRKMIEKI